jgi:hypothetical protein
MSVQLPLAHLHDVNGRLRGLLESLLREGATPGPQQLTALLSDLLDAGAYLQDRSIRRDVEEQVPAIHEYQRLLTELQRLLPELHARFLAERALLERERHHLAVAASWSDTARRTTYFK